MAYGTISTYMFVLKELAIGHLEIGDFVLLISS